ncbi:Glutathione S-transferase [Rhynchospora pubera]|uniref:glutathione transferase n=1 Tax=Rhynchospora pubera TaxID=906938 RepID=A0AAV8H5G8_9POAL|nr:Glutathione S-transferase [Rhynchospora pubera]
MASSNRPVLLSLWVSPISQRVRITLAEKAVEYEYKEEDVFNKSELLLKSNPVHKKVPVLIHNSRTICESLVIMEYIDEVWPDKVKILPSDPYQRAQARFWADFSNKVRECGHRLWQKKGEEQEVAKKEMIEKLKLFETELGDKKYFGGDVFGFVDIPLVPFTSWCMSLCAS